MRLKRLAILRTLLGLTLAVALTASAAEAQLSGGQWRISPVGGSKGVQKKPDVVVAPVQPVQPIAFTFVPAILMSDGSVFANFGFGFEPVLRSCTSSSVVVTGPMQVVASNGVVLSQPTGLQPVPAPLTPSQQNLSSARNGQVVTTSTAAQMSCFTRDASGRVFVIR